MTKYFTFGAPGEEEMMPTQTTASLENLGFCAEANNVQILKLNNRLEIKKLYNKLCLNLLIVEDLSNIEEIKSKFIESEYATYKSVNEETYKYLNMLIKIEEYKNSKKSFEEPLENELIESNDYQLCQIECQQNDDLNCVELPSNDENKLHDQQKEDLVNSVSDCFKSSIPAEQVSIHSNQTLMPYICDQTKDVSIKKQIIPVLCALNLAVETCRKQYSCVFYPTTINWSNSKLNIALIQFVVNRIKFIKNNLGDVEVRYVASVNNKTDLINNCLNNIDDTLFNFVENPEANVIYANMIFDPGPLNVEENSFKDTPLFERYSSWCKVFSLPNISIFIENLKQQYEPG